MTVLIGASDGVYRASDVPFEIVEQVLDTGFVTGIATFDAVDGTFAATTTGLYHSTDTGDSWDDLSVPTESVWSVHATEVGLYAGTAPAHLYRSTDGGRTWTDVKSLQEQPSHSKWTAPGSIPPRLRTLGTHPEAPERLVVGIEAGKLHVTEDGGKTWIERDDPVPDDIHHVNVRAPNEFIVSTGYLGVDGEQPGGLYRTTDAGETWARLDTGDRAYFREAIDHDGRLYVSAARDAPPWWAGGADAVLYESNDDETLTAVSYPSGPAEVIDAWAVIDGHVIAGTVFRSQESTRPIDVSTAAGSSGSVLQRTKDGEWRQVGNVPAGIHSIASM
ncbi:WD40/YVTN/BNR-like repeat-containing protein [Halocatena pleomorpha]|uniref:Glycosyl hydrolase n=1 Tax=Halocatena pleomorpha TaxID=1785090 RepID=A0A3P3RMH2_9EURY|nr:glycosyl hydrolase [Halocatena pleomorpha]RRJ34058.1 glycosyl hydrolase [Halocatena pleomorpha]